MERNFYTEGFEGFLKDKADQYKLYPSEKVWKNINRQLHPRRKWPYLTAALLLLGIGVGGKIYLDDANSPGLIHSLQQSGINIMEANPAEMENTRFNFPADVKKTQSPVLSTGSVSLNRSPLRIAYINPVLSISKTKTFEPGTFQTEGNNNELNEVIANPLMQEISNRERTNSGMVSPDIKVQHAPTLQEFKMIPLPVQAFKSNLPTKKEVKQSDDLSATEKVIARIRKVKNKTALQFYLSPGISYRRLIGKATDIPFSYSGVLYNTNASAISDASDAVNHKPAFGIELGTALVYPLTDNLRVKAGFQFNYNRYDIEAYSYKPEVATFGIDNSGITARSINTISYYRNFSGNEATILRNERFMVSLPVGIEISLLGNERVKFNVASTIQPTYIFNNNSFLISTNLKNYAQESRLYRNWNVNFGMEAYISVKTGIVNWVVGPQFRYQLLSSYKDNYPISEHLVDYGFKVGITTTLK